MQRNETSYPYIFEVCNYPSQRTYLTQKSDREVSDGSITHHHSDSPAAPRGVLAGRDRQTVLDQHPAYHSRLHPWHSPRRLGHREILEPSAFSFSFLADR